MTIDRGADDTRRVRHEVADGVRLMAFSLGSSIGLGHL
jgi:hypothetical protein